MKNAETPNPAAAAAALPDFPTIESAIRELIAQGTTRIDQIAAGLPPGMQVPAEQIRAVLDEILSSTNLAALRDAVSVDVFQLLMTGHSTVKHNPVNLA